MALYEIITIAAIVLGPILAVQAEKYLERRRDNRKGRVGIFKTLMATRGSSLSRMHVEALNRIDLEFSDDPKYKKIITSWKEYFDNLNQRPETEQQITVWAAKNEELLANLLYEMGQSLGYRFDKVLIKRNIYSPEGHARVELENQLIRKGVLDILNSETAIPMTLISDDDTLKRQVYLQEMMTKYYKKQTGEE